MIYAIIAAVLWGVAAALDKVGLRDSSMSPGLAVVIRSVVVAVGLLAAFAVTGQARHLSHMKLSSVIFLALSGLCAGLFGQWFYYRALKPGEASVVVPLVGAYPLITAILGIVIFKETLSWQKAAGAMLIISGVFLLKWQR